MNKYRCVKKHRDPRDFRLPVKNQRVIEVGDVRSFDRDPGRFCWEPAPESTSRASRKKAE